MIEYCSYRRKIVERVKTECELRVDTITYLGYKPYRTVETPWITLTLCMMKDAVSCRAVFDSCNSLTYCHMKVLPQPPELPTPFSKVLKRECGMKWEQAVCEVFNTIQKVNLFSIHFPSESLLPVLGKKALHPVWVLKIVKADMNMYIFKVRLAGDGSLQQKRVVMIILGNPLPVH